MNTPANFRVQYLISVVGIEYHYPKFLLRIVPISFIHRDLLLKMNLLLAASGIISACRCARAQSLTSTTPSYILGNPGTHFVIKVLMISPLVKSVVT